MHLLLKEKVHGDAESGEEEFGLVETYKLLLKYA
jgi:hypothetical protein